jgi:hypothetical protein
LYSERDAQSIFDVLISPEGGNFHRENVHLLIGAKATLANMRHELEEWLPSQAKDGDRVLIYFAGHGFLFAGHGYLAPYDIDRAKSSKPAIPWTKWARRSPGRSGPKTRSCLTDSCHSGAIRPEDFKDINHALIDLDKSLFSLTASRDREVSYEHPQWGGGHGIFTYYVVRGLEGEADENGDGVVTADELYDYVYRNVREATATRPRDNRTPPTARAASILTCCWRTFPAGPSPALRPRPKRAPSSLSRTWTEWKCFWTANRSAWWIRAKRSRCPAWRREPTPSKGVRMGYEPDGPREETVYPGRETPVSIKIMIRGDTIRRRPMRWIKAWCSTRRVTSRTIRRLWHSFRRPWIWIPNTARRRSILARAYNALFDEQNAEKYFRKAIEIDPDYLEARASFGRHAAGYRETRTKPSGSSRRSSAVIPTTCWRSPTWRKRTHERDVQGFDRIGPQSSQAEVGHGRAASLDGR